MALDLVELTPDLRLLAYILQNACKTVYRNSPAEARLLEVFD